jgi:hypothetical protein
MVDLEKIKEIRDWPSPKSIFEVRSFHGLASFYRKSIRNFSGICAPMMDLVKKRHKYFHWIEGSEKGFKLLEIKITKEPVLALPDFSKTFQVRCDPSGFPIGVVLGQDSKPIAYLSEKVNEANIKYSTYEKEFYADIQALKKW